MRQSSANERWSTYHTSSSMRSGHVSPFRPRIWAQPVTPALQAVRDRTRLTAAERTVAGMAAAGRSNKEIAAELELSVRTVENHLQRTYEKLGGSSRAELQSGLEAVE